MTADTVALSSISVGEELIITSVEGKGEMRQRLRDLGFVKDTRIRCIMKSPLGDPTAYYARGAVIALRHEDAIGIIGRKRVDGRES